MSEPERSPAMRRPNWAALLIAAGLVLVALVMVWSTSQIGGAAGYARIGPATFPYIVAAGIFVLALWTAVAAWRGEFPARAPQNLSPVLWIVGGLVAQMLLLKPVGFSIGTGLLFAATARGFGRGPLWMTIPLGIVLSLAVWTIFAKGLQLSLPAGLLESLI